jgi:hypothetical protein
MVVYPCSTWVGRVGLVTWQSLQSPEGGRIITAIGGLLVILYHLRKGTVPGGRPLADALGVLLSIAFVGLLWVLMLQAISSWDANAKAQCTAYMMRKIL